MLHRTQCVNTSYHRQGKVLNLVYKSLAPGPLTSSPLASLSPLSPAHTILDEVYIPACSVFHVPWCLLGLGIPSSLSPSKHQTGTLLLIIHCGAFSVTVPWRTWQSTRFPLLLTAMTLFVTFLLDGNFLRAVCLWIPSIGGGLDT